MDGVSLHVAERRAESRGERVVLERHVERLGVENAKRPAAREGDARGGVELAPGELVAMCGVLEAVVTEESPRATARLHPDFLQGDDVGGVRPERVELSPGAVDRRPLDVPRDKPEFGR